MIESPTATTSAWSTPKTTTQPVVTPAIATSTRSIARERSPGGGVDDVDPGSDDHRAEHRLRQVLHRLGQEEEDHDDRPGREEAGDLRPRAHRVVHRGARTARTDRERPA